MRGLWVVIFEYNEKGVKIKVSYFRCIWFLTKDEKGEKVMIQGNMCEKCSKENVCSRQAKLAPFRDDAKKDLGIVIKIISCENYAEKED